MQRRGGLVITAGSTEFSGIIERRRWPRDRRRHADPVRRQQLHQRHADRCRRHPGPEGQRLDRQRRLRHPRRRRHARHLADDFGRYRRGLFGSAAGIVNLGGQTLTISGSGSTFDGVIQGSGGGLVITGGATQELSGTNTYTGATTIGANSTLSLSNAGSIAASSGVNLAGAFATFDISLGTGDKTIQALSGVAGSSVLLGNNNLTVGSATSTTFAGVIDGSGGIGGLVKVGTGTLTLSGANTYTGGTTINGGALSISADNNLGDAAGGLTFGGGTLQITGANVNSVRTVTLGAGGGTFDIGQNANLLGTIGGTGSLTKTGTGTLALSGANTYTGGTTITGGLINFARQQPRHRRDHAERRQPAMGAGNTTDISARWRAGAAAARSTPTATTSRWPAHRRHRRLTKAGAGTLTLGGTNTYSGGTTVSGGTCRARRRACRATSSTTPP